MLSKQGQQTLKVHCPTDRATAAPPPVRSRRALRLEFDADLPVPMPNLPAPADRFVGIEDHVETFGDADHARDIEAGAALGQIAHHAVDRRTVCIEEDARRFERSHPHMLTAFRTTHETPPLEIPRVAPSATIARASEAAVTAIETTLT